jgi:hypothetical protein
MDLETTQDYLVPGPQKFLKSSADLVQKTWEDSHCPFVDNAPC